MENKKLTWEEIVECFKQEWVLLEDYEWPDEEVDPKSGRVCFHAPTREVFDQLLKDNEDAVGKEVAIVYTGRPLVSQNFQGGFGHIEIVDPHA